MREKGTDQMTEICSGRRLVEAEVFGLVVGAAVGPEKEVHEGRDIGVVPGVAVAIMVPVMQLRGTEKPAQRPRRQADVRVDVNRPNPAEGNEARERLQWETEYKR